MRWRIPCFPWIGLALTTVLLQEQWEQVQSAPFLDELAEPGRLEGPRAGLPGLPPEATPGEIVAALQQIVLRDLKQVQQAQENHSIPPHKGRGQVGEHSCSASCPRRCWWWEQPSLLALPWQAPGTKPSGQRRPAK